MPPGRRQLTKNLKGAPRMTQGPEGVKRGRRRRMKTRTKVQAGMER